MQSTVQLQSSSARESRQRRSAIMTAIYALAILVSFVLGLWLMLAFALPEAFFSAIALSAILSDPMRRHLHEILE